MFIDGKSFSPIASATLLARILALNLKQGIPAIDPGSLDKHVKNVGNPPHFANLPPALLDSVDRRIASILVAHLIRYPVLSYEIIKALSDDTEAKGFLAAESHMQSKEKDPRVFHLAYILLSEKDEESRIFAVKALANLASLSNKIVHILGKFLLQEESERVAEQIAEELSHTGDQRAIPYINQRLKREQSESCKFHLQRILNKFGSS